ncbi:Short chain dehydrogenase citE [Lachnellula suecica]|uniref:Short chain dehydrogenase citE n=1 Tax=Lachnellula suecica TaxID=602035 RepID=A0A8T9BXA5_9HELO|nr:Short chain dehydrogenase citE [Lachnellula suecica]
MPNLARMNLLKTRRTRMSSNGLTQGVIENAPANQGSFASEHATGLTSIEGPAKGEDEAKTPEVESLSKAFGIMKVDQIEQSTLYIGGAHWVSIISEIEEFRTYLAANAERLEENALSLRKSSRDVRKAPSLLRGIDAPASREELLSHLPPQELILSRVNRFFSFYGLSLPFIHEPTFRREVESHCKDPSKAKIIWLGLLFAVLHLAEQSYDAAEDLDPNGAIEVTGQYKSRIIQCLIASGYTNPVAYTIETLVLYIEAEWHTAQDASIETSMILGLAIRLAMRMGLHRDPCHYDLTPFQSEMRRRLWAVIHRGDILYSFQLSLPPVIRQKDCTCGIPRNINNNEFGETTDLPPSRPIGEWTDASYFIIKYRLLLVLGNVIEFVNDPLLPNERFQELQASTSEVCQEIPPFLRLEYQASSSETTSLKKQKIHLDRLYQLTQCLLHRNFLRSPRPGSTAIAHRDSCISAALALLAHQSSIFLGFDSMYPHIIRKQHMALLINQDFFIAAMTVALDLKSGFQTDFPIPSDFEVWGFDRRDEMIAALESSIEFWRIVKDESVEAAKAYGLFSFAIRDIKVLKWRAEESMRGNDGVWNTAGHSADPHPLGDMSEFDWELWASQNGTYDPDYEDFHRVDEVEQAISKCNPSVKTRKIILDISDDDQVLAAASRITSEEGRLDILINNAGYSPDWVPIADGDVTDYLRTWEVNMKGVYLMTRRFLPLLVDTAKKQGTLVNIVNMSSIGAHFNFAGSSAYNVTKFALLRFTEYVDLEYSKAGVNCVAVHPGGVLTELSKNIEQIKDWLPDTPDLCGGFLVWLTKGQRSWTNGRYLASAWDVDELEAKKDEIVQGDKLKMRMVV